LPRISAALSEIDEKKIDEKRRMNAAKRSCIASSIEQIGTVPQPATSENG
jgi:hypothetical protein